MTEPKPTRGLPTITFEVPTYWTPEQALAVVELLDDLREAIWGFYDLQLIDLIREQHTPRAGEPPVAKPDTSDQQSF
jgi:hypothetical protein